MRYTFFLVGLLPAIISMAQVPNHQHRASSGIERLAAVNKQEALLQQSPYRNLQWRNVGPDNVSGRSTDVWGVPGNRQILYAGFATGGLWKSLDAGQSWFPIFDHQGTLSIGNLALAPSNPDIIYVGTGEANIFRASLPGIGVFKSTDGGSSWQQVGLTNTSTIARIVIHPTNPDIVYVAAGGNEWSYNTERGVYQTRDGGKTWKKILGQDSTVGCIDLRMDPSDPNTIYAAMWHRIRRRWSDPVPEDRDYIYKTTDGGKTWKPLTTGLPPTQFTGRVGLAVANSNPNVVYAFVDNHEKKREPAPGEKDSYGRLRAIVVKGVEVYRSADKGEHWTKMSANDEYMEKFCGTYGWVMGQIRVNPQNENSVYILGLAMGKSVDGGRTWSRLAPTAASSDPLHGDNHGLWIDPSDSNYIINGDDGGVALTYDGGKTWKNFYRRIPTTQFYNITYDNLTPYTIIGSVQDEGSLRGSIRNTYGLSDSSIQAWAFGPGGEGVIHAIDPGDAYTIYTSSFYGRLIKANLHEPDSLWARDIAPKKAADEEEHRGEWLAYTLISPHDRLRIYHGMQYLFTSADSGFTWTRISGDMSFNDPTKMGKTPYAINHQAITAIAESYFQKGQLYVGTDDGRIWRSEPDGRDWVSLNRANLPVNAHVSRMIASRHDAHTVYLALNDRREDNIRPYLYRSVDDGKTWVNICGNLPESPVNVIREDPAWKNWLYCGTDLGVYFSPDAGGHWIPLNNNLPAGISVQDLFIHPATRQLVIATYGRGIYALDQTPTHSTP